jgi:hypothetical protein
VSEPVERAATAKKPHKRLHVGVNPVGKQYWWMSRGVHTTLGYVSSAEAIAVGALVLNCD